VAMIASFVGSVVFDALVTPWRASGCLGEISQDRHAGYDVLCERLTMGLVAGTMAS
jgi:hypothetical protein